MTAREVLDCCFRHFVLAKRASEDITLEALFPDDFPIPPELIEQVRRHKPEVLALLSYQERADAALLASTSRLAAAWPSGYPLEGQEWEAHERALHAAYWSGDLNRLEAALEAREAYALLVFDHYRNEVTR